MIFLLDFSPIKPDFGLLLWSSIIFILFWLLMGKMAFGPIKEALKKRESDIQDALDEAKKAREEMSNLKAQNEQILAEAREERSKILKQAKEMKDSMIKDAKEKAREEAQKIVTNAKNEIDNLKSAALVDLKNQSGMMALEIAEKIIKKQLSGDSEQEKFANSLIDDIKLN